MWTYDPKKMSTGDGHDLLPRVAVEEAAERLCALGMKRYLVIDVLKTLSRLPRGEIEFTVSMLPQREIAPLVAGKSRYCLCMTCNAKWFAKALALVCPRCGGQDLLSDTAVQPWKTRAASDIGSRKE